MVSLPSVSPQGVFNHSYPGKQPSSSDKTALNQFCTSPNEDLSFFDLKFRILQLDVKSLYAQASRSFRRNSYHNPTEKQVSESQ